MCYLLLLVVAVCCALCAVCCLLFVVCCSLFGVWCFVHGAGCLVLCVMLCCVFGVWCVVFDVCVWSLVIVFGVVVFLFFCMITPLLFGCLKNVGGYELCESFPAVTRLTVYRRPQVPKLVRSAAGAPCMSFNFSALCCRSIVPLVVICDAN